MLCYNSNARQYKTHEQTRDTLITGWLHDKKCKAKTHIKSRSIMFTDILLDPFIDNKGAQKAVVVSFSRFAVNMSKL